MSNVPQVTGQKGVHTKTTGNKVISYFSMFSGVGGFEKGIEQAYESNNRRLLQSKSTEDLLRQLPDTSFRQDRIACAGYSEIDPYAIKVYEKHFPTHRNYGDATKIDATELPDFDLLVGGFPCQTFSIAGKRRGFDDTRGTLFFDIARILKEKRPRNFVLENVKGLLSHDAGRTFKTIITTLAELGYCVEWQVLNSKNHGVPQNRERVFIVGHLGKIPERKVFPLGEGGTTHDTKNVLAHTINSSDWRGANRNQKQTTIEYKSDRQDSGQNKTTADTDQPFIIHNIYGGFGEEKVREFHDFSPTIRTPKGGGHIPNVVAGARIRRLSVVECARLQGFPDDWCVDLSDSRQYKAYGNAVTVNVVQAVISKLLSL